MVQVAPPQGGQTDAEIVRLLGFAIEQAIHGAHVRVLGGGGPAAEEAVRWQELAFALCEREPGLSVHVPRAAASDGAWLKLAPRDGARDIDELLVEARRGDVARVNVLLRELAVAHATDERAAARGAGASAALALANADGLSALHAAARGGHAPTVALLLAAGADFEQLDAKMGTPLMRACRHGHTAAATLLLNAGAHADSVQRDGLTALMLGARGGHAETVALLCERGADVRARALRGATALALALEHGHAGVARTLRAHGAVDLRALPSCDDVGFAHAWWYRPLTEGARVAARPDTRPTRPTPEAATAMLHAQRRIDAADRADGRAHDGGHWRTLTVRQEMEAERLARRWEGERAHATGLQRARAQQLGREDARAQADGRPMRYRTPPPPLPEPPSVQCVCW
jgi:ankyrin repeat protein